MRSSLLVPGLDKSAVLPTCGLFSSGRTRVVAGPWIHAVKAREVSDRGASDYGYQDEQSGQLDDIRRLDVFWRAWEERFRAIREGNECGMRFARMHIKGRLRKHYTCNRYGEIYNCMFVHHERRHRRMKCLCETPLNAHPCNTSFPVRIIRA